MKIPFLPLHIHIITERTREQRTLKYRQMNEKLDAMRWITSGCIPELDQLIITLREAKIGASAYGRRKKRRKVERETCELQAELKEEGRDATEEQKDNRNR